MKSEESFALRCHWKPGVGTPEAATVNVALPPIPATWAVGWVVMLGAVRAPLRRTVWLNVSATQRFPPVSTAMP